MKKYFRILFVLIVTLIMFIQMPVFAEENAYEYFDFKFEVEEGKKINDTKIKIFATLDENGKNLVDRTDEFNIDEIMWSEISNEDDSQIYREVEEDAVFEKGKEYYFMIRITAKNEADINAWGTDRAKLNGTPIEELDGEFGNTGKELMIKSKVIVYKNETVTKTTNEEIKKPNITDTQDNTLPTFLGLSIYVWIIILILIILLIIIIVILKNKKKKENN